MSAPGVYVIAECDGKGSCGRDCPGRPHSCSRLDPVGPEIDTPVSGPTTRFEIELASGRKFIIHALDEGIAREVFKTAVERALLVQHKDAGATVVTLRPIGELGEIVAVRPEPPVKTTLQEGPSWKKS